ncbi:MAG TPA: choice-of-anchor V domain-containing protein [Bryobacteraceae bacterium]|nr:choice-of-anchor V domain-containing protein [Bryobacteraceae bacterium]
MIRSAAKKLVYSAFCAFPVLLFAFSSGPPIMRTGAPADGGITCVACHRTYAPADSDPRGGVQIAASPYTPGVTQTIRVTIHHPEQKRWGFQLTARLASNPAKQAGTFAVNGLVRVRCSGGHDAPCNGALEFAEHSNAQSTAVGAGFTYTVDWTPPSAAVGDVIFYAAGNAANGDGTFNGDRIYTTSAVVSPSQCDLGTLPLLSAAVNAASFQGPVSPGSIIAIFGSGFQPGGLTRGLYPADVTSGSVPVRLSCVAVEIDRKRAPMTFVSANQINVQVPAGASTSNSEVRVIVNPDAPAPVYSSSLVVTSGVYAPGLFTLDGLHAIAQFAGTETLVGDPSVNPAAKPARPGDMITLYATGLGETKPHLDAGVLVTSATPCVNQPAIAIGGIAVPPADIQYVGLVPGMISGLYQINLKLPAVAPAGDLPVRLTVGGVSSQDKVSVRVAAP